jgi:predicted secreted protein
MKFTSILAIYTLFWCMSFFFVLPFRLRSSDQPEAHVPGQADSAPPRFSFARTCLWTTIVSAALFGLYYANYVNGWLKPEALDLFTPRR